MMPQLMETVFKGLGIGWACSLLGFISSGPMPIPWVLFKYGPQIRTQSKYGTVDYA